MRRDFAVLLVFLLFFGTMIGCGGSSSPAAPTTPTSTPTPVPTPTPPYAGSWRGTTSDNLPITFTVVGDSVENLTVDLYVGVGWTVCSKTFTAIGPATLSGNPPSFDVHVTNPAGYDTVLRGSFASFTSASGSVETYWASEVVCGNGTGWSNRGEQEGGETWQATKQ